MQRLLLALVGTAVAWLAACTAPQLDYRLPALQPEGASGYSEKPGWVTRQFAVAAANPLATDAGYQVLRAGGSAVDAAIAVQMVLTLVEPQSSGIGGGAFLMHFDGRRVQAFDGRETAPAAAGEDLFLGSNGQPLPFMQAVVGGRPVGVPGVLRMLELAHRQHGRLPWASLFQPAIALAEQGFAVSPRLHALLAGDTALRAQPAAASYFYGADGQAHPVGHRLRNPQLANVLRHVAEQGASAFYQGDVAHDIVAAVRQHPENPGRLTLQDLAAYRALEREALCHPWQTPGRDVRICGFPPPSSGAIAVGQILGLLERSPVAAERLGPDGLPSARWLHHYMEASRLAFADRAQYVADPAFVPAPGGSWSQLLAPDYLARRATLIGERRRESAPAGSPGTDRLAFAPMPDQPERGTSHISIVDRWGHAVAMTTTIESAFGSRLMVRGFLLNNQLTDFSFAPRGADGRPIANRVEPGKRPRSSMAPTLVFDGVTGQLLMSGGSPGGALIIHYTAKWLQGALAWGLAPQAAISLPNFGTVGGPVLLETQRFPQPVRDALSARGHDVRETEMTSGLQAIARGQLQEQPVWLGGADPRREGVVMGD